MFEVKALLLLCSLTPVCYGNSTFIHLFGYGLLGDTLSTITTTDYMDCIAECIGNSGCMAIQMIRSDDTCNLMTMIRDYTYEEAQCSFFVRKETDMTILNRSLTDMEQVIQNVVYASKNVCPDGWTNRSTTCTLSISESVCDEYASFLEATWDGTECVIPILIPPYSCLNSVFTRMNFTDGFYCYAVIARDADVLPSGLITTNNNEGTTPQMANDYCYQQTGGYLASIHSEEENDFIASLKNGSVATNGIAIGLVPVDDSDRSASQYIWLDNTSMDYENFYPAPAQAFYVNFGLLTTNNNTWYTGFAMEKTFWQMFKSLACKVKATVAFTIAN